MFGHRYNFIAPVIILIIAVCVSAFIVADFKLKASVLQIARAKAQAQGVEVINKAVNDNVVSRVQYNDLVLVHKDLRGRIVMVQPNTIVLNKIMTETTMEVSRRLGQMEETEISVPLGQISGAEILAGYGPKINVKIIPAGQVHVDVLNKFEQSGINQTRHLIYFKILSNIKVAVPLMGEEVEVVSIVPLAETIIVGEVPETYVDFNGQSEAIYPFLKD